MKKLEAFCVVLTSSMCNRNSCTVFEALSDFFSQVQTKVNRISNRENKWKNNKKPNQCHCVSIFSKVDLTFKIRQRFFNCMIEYGARSSWLTEDRSKTLFANYDLMNSFVFKKFQNV